MSHAPAVSGSAPKAEGYTNSTLVHATAGPTQASYLCGLAASRLGYDRMRRRRVSEKALDARREAGPRRVWVDGAASKDARRGVMCAP